MTGPNGTPRGLGRAEAAARLAAEGWNELPRGPRRTVLRIVFELLREPMFQLLLAAGVIYLVLGDLGEALLLLGFATGSFAITIVQSTRTERSLEALRELSSPRALVIRDGEQQRIPGREVVRGDLVLLVEGDRVPADLRLLTARALQADESLLTGESVPVSKLPSDAPAGTPQPGGDGLPWLFSGSLVVRGEGLGEVVATGPRTELGKIGRLLQEVEPEPTALHVQTRRIVRLVASLGLGVSLLVALIYGATRADWLGGLLAGIAVAMSMLPEEFPVVLTVFLALGARRMAQRRVLTRRPAAIEALGATTVLCSDKTGTLTENRMGVAELRLDGVAALADTPLPEAFLPLLRAAALACKPIAVDPMDRALHRLAAQALVDEDALAAAGTLRREYGLTPELPVMAMVWQAAGGHGIVAAKGAPEAIARLCRYDDAMLAALRGRIDEMAARGQRVLGVATAAWPADAALPDAMGGFAFVFAGLVGFSDPLRPAAAAAIEECRGAGIRVAMITGDYPATARAIAREAGIADGGLLTGAELETLSDAELRRRVREVSVYARVLPRQKLRIVEALKADGEVVAMTGDGVNDAPSLKAAHIGVAMGGRGTDVAREAAGLVLLDDDFSSLARAVREGRHIYDKLRKAMSYILAVHVPIAGLSLLPLLFGWPLLLLPAHIVFLELVIDPVCSVVFEAEGEEDDLMRRPPRAPGQPLFTRRLVGWALLQGVAVLALVLLLVHEALARGLAVDTVRALGFVALVSGNASLIFCNRSFGHSALDALRRPNPVLWPVLLVTAGLLTTVLNVPALRALFHFGPVAMLPLAVALGSGLVLLPALELLKRLARRHWPASA